MRLRQTRAGALLLQGTVLVAGALFVVLGFALAVLPGPLTIPPVLLGVWIWATEFDWADRLLQRVAAKAQTAWAQTRRHPVSAAAATAGGIGALVVGLALARRYDVVDRLTGWLR